MLRQKSVSRRAASKPTVERLEARALFAAPQVTSVYADNRGEVQITFNQALDPATVNTRTVFVHTGGTDGVFGTADDLKITGRVKLTAGNKRIWYRPAEKVPFVAGSSYSIKVSGKLVKGAGGERVDGEFNGPGVTSGNGTAGGDFLALSKRDKGTRPVARYSTFLGNMDVELYGDKTPKNVSNFFTYSSTGAWDNTFIQRNLPGFIFQLGGYTVTDQNAIDDVTQVGTVDNEPSPTQAERGTISIARPDDNNPATDDKGSNEFFFNLVDNEANLGAQNGGFTEFGKINSAAGLAVMDALSAFPTVNGGGVFANLAVKDNTITVQQASTDPQNTLILIRRVAVRNKIVAWA